LPPYLLRSIKEKRPFISKRARQLIDAEKNFSLSAVTYIELVQGMRNKRELNIFRKALHCWNAKVIYISEGISAKAMFYVEQHFLSHSLQLADALVASTAVEYGMPLFSANTKQYKVIKDVQLKMFKPG
jgi:hypothetical protein